MRIEIAAQEIWLGLDAAVPCALIINELITNSLKHAFPQGQPDRIETQMGRRPDASVRVVVADNGVGKPASQDLSFAPKTLGLRR